MAGPGDTAGAATLIGGVGGLVVGMVTGTVLHLLAGAAILGNRAQGLSPARLSAVAFLITGVASFALLDVLFHGSPGILIYPPAAAAALLAIPLSRRLPLSRQPPKRQ
jgi:hypothetical protein